MPRSAVHTPQGVTRGLAVPVFMYHEVTTDRELSRLAGRIQWGYVLTVDAFHAHLQALREAGATSIDLDQLLEWQQGRCELPEVPVILTFDDGFEGNCSHALPALLQAGYGATFFVISNRIGDPAMMDWRAVRELAAAGMSVGSHTANHPLLSRIDAARTFRELQDSRRKIEDELGRSVRHLSLPNGDSNAHYVRAASEAGYLSGCSSAFGLNQKDTPRFYLRRIAVKRSLPSATVGAIARGNRRVLRSLARRAALKALPARLLGKRLYDRLYNAAFGVAEQDKSLEK